MSNPVRDYIIDGVADHWGLSREDAMRLYDDPKNLEFLVCALIGEVRSARHRAEMEKALSNMRGGLSLTR